MIKLASLVLSKDKDSNTNNDNDNNNNHYNNNNYNNKNNLPTTIILFGQLKDFQGTI